MMIKNNLFYSNYQIYSNDIKSEENLRIISIAGCIIVMKFDNQNILNDLINKQDETYTGVNE